MGMFSRPRARWLRGVDGDQGRWTPWTVVPDRFPPRSRKEEPKTNEEIAEHSKWCAECPGGARCCQYPE